MKIGHHIKSFKTFLEGDVVDFAKAKKRLRPTEKKRKLSRTNPTLKLLTPQLLRDLQEHFYLEPGGGYLNNPDGIIVTPHNKEESNNLIGSTEQIKYRNQIKKIFDKHNYYFSKDYKNYSESLRIIHPRNLKILILYIPVATNYFELSEEL